MLSSLRFRLPALFLAGIVVAGIVSTLIAFQLLQNYSHNQSLAGLRRDARGLSQLYAKTAIKSIDQGLSAPFYTRPFLEQATGDRLYYVGLPIFPGEGSVLRQLRHLSKSQLDWKSIQERKSVSQGFQSFIGLSFQTGSQFLHSVTVTACNRVRRRFQKFANFFKSVLMPDFEHDDFALFGGQLS